MLEYLNEIATDNLTWKNQSFPIYTSFLVEVINGLLCCGEELQRLQRE